MKKQPLDIEHSYGSHSPFIDDRNDTPIHSLKKLVGGFKHFLFSISFFWDVILPIDYIIFFSGVGHPPTRKSWLSIAT
jgi:hypothetical protein